MKYVNYNYLVQEEIATILITELIDKLPAISYTNTRVNR